jgi:hypothetical protein
MRKSLLMVGIPVSVLGLGLAGFIAMRVAAKPQADDFAKELEKADAAGIQLAQAQAANQFSLSETVPEAKPEPKTVTKRGAGTKAVRSNAPTVRAAAEPVRADVVEEIPDLTVVAQSTGPSHTEASVRSTPSSSPVYEPAPSQDQGSILRGGSGAGAGRTGGGSGMGTAIGVIFGSVIRGGGVDGDNCELHRRRPTNTSVQRPDYGSNPSGMAGVRTGGWGGGSVGTTTVSRPRGR